MDKRIKAILILFILVLMVTIIGNHIHMILVKRGMGHKGKDTYLKKIESRIAILIEVDKKQLLAIDLNSNSIVKTYAVATGRDSTPTPLGTFKVVEKAKWGGGFGSRWLGLNVPWGKYGIHGTNRPGSIGFNASGGCIRMRNKDVEELFDLVENNATVAIIRGEYGPFANGFRILRPGDRGADVMEVQKRLKLDGHYMDGLDGIYGDGTKRALIHFLKENDLPMTDRIGEEIYKKMDIILMD